MRQESERANIAPVCEKPSKDATERIKQALFHLRSHRFDDAIAGFKSVLSRDWGNFQAAFELANTFRLVEDFDRAVDYYLRAITIDHHVPGPHIRLLFTDVTDEQAERIVKRGRELIEARPQAHQIHTTVAYMLDRLGRSFEAIDELRIGSRKRAQVKNPKQYDATWDHRQFSGPQFMIIGGMRCGSTSLFESLIQHPDLIEPAVKEIHFFDQKYEKGMDWYNAHFAPIPSASPLMTGEATPMICSPGVPQRVQKHFPDAQLILTLRNPVERAHSHCQHMVQWFGYNWDFQKAVERDLEQATSQGIDSENFDMEQVESGFCRESLYVHWIREWKKCFPDQQFHVFTSDQLFERADETVNAIFKFLGVEGFQLESYRKSNRGHYQGLDPELRGRLADYFRPANEALSEMLKLTLAWD